MDPKTEAGKRAEEYRRVLGDLDIIVCRGNIFSFVDKFLMALGMMWQKKYDVITAQDIEHSFLAWMLSRLHSVPWQMQIHTDIFSPHFVGSSALPAGRSVLNKIRVWLARFLIPRANGVRVVSKRIHESILWRLNLPQEVQPPKIVTLSVFVDVEKIKNAPIKTDLHKKYGRDRFIILMASRITREKNIVLAIEAVKDLNATLIIVGNGPESDNLKRGAPKNVVFESRTDDLASYYKTCDLFLLASNYEGYGMTLVEATAAGAKIISSDVGIAPEILDPVAIFKVGDKEDLKQKLISALENKLPTPRLPKELPTKDEYLRLYKESLAICLKQRKKSE